VDGVIRASDCSTPHVCWSGGELGGAETRPEVCLSGFGGVFEYFWMGFGEYDFCGEFAAWWWWLLRLQAHRICTGGLGSRHTDSALISLRGRIQQLFGS
jgi:hypothetical protein